MSKTTKKKLVVQEQGEFVLPTNVEEIVKITSSRGNNLHEVETIKGDRFLVSMPPKYRKTIWIKRGDFVIIEPIEEGDKVKAEIKFILDEEHIKDIKQQKLWPKEFDNAKQTNKESSRDDCAPDKSDGGESDDDSDLFVNTNRPQNYVTDESSEESSDESQEEK